MPRLPIERPREGHTWRVGDADNKPGRSLSVHLTGSYAGRWTDFATGEHGDLLDVIARIHRLRLLRDVVDEARRFLALGQVDWEAPPSHGSDVSALRFHPSCFYRAHEQAPRQSWPVLLAAVTDLNGNITGIQRTWLQRDGSDKAPVHTPRRALGRLSGHGVRLSVVADVMAAGEGLETMLSLREVLPNLPVVAALSARHLAALQLPPGLKRLHVACDNDADGRRAAHRLRARAIEDGVEVLILTPQADDFNTDLRMFGRQELAVSLRDQLAAKDVTRFLAL